MKSQYDFCMIEKQQKLVWWDDENLDGTSSQEKTVAGLRSGVDTFDSCCVAIFCLGLSVTFLS
jgi:hypothetical protein